jgi:hemerythrin-like domain-containing protein
MNTATQNLENDHVYILRLIDSMEAMSEQHCTNTEHLEIAVNLIRKFVDGFHHAKEEKLLFPMMITKGFSDQQGPVAAMLSEHELGRMYAAEMAKNIELLKQGKTTVLVKIYSNMKSYGILLRNHIAKENNVLFRMADQVLNFNEQQILLADFAKAENDADPEFNSENSLSKINNLAAIYLQ